MRSLRLGVVGYYTLVLYSHGALTVHLQVKTTNASEFTIILMEFNERKSETISVPGSSRSDRKSGDGIFKNPSSLIFSQRQWYADLSEIEWGQWNFRFGNNKMIIQIFVAARQKNICPVLFTVGISRPDTEPNEIV